MAKKRTVVGSVLKSNDPLKPNYIKFSDRLEGAVSFTAGQCVSVESKAFQLASLERAVAANKLSGENAEKARERINKMPDFVLGDLVTWTE